MHYKVINIDNVYFNCNFMYTKGNVATFALLQTQKVLISLMIQEAKSEESTCFCNLGRSKPRWIGWCCIYGVTISIFGH